MENEQLEELAMIIIANSGAARSSAIEAMSCARKGDFEKADELMTAAEAQLSDAHAAHTKLLQLDAKGEIEKVSILLTHAQDHLMTSILADELAKEIIFLHKKTVENS